MHTNTKIRNIPRRRGCEARGLSHSTWLPAIHRHHHQQYRSVSRLPRVFIWQDSTLIAKNPFGDKANSRWCIWLPFFLCVPYSITLVVRWADGAWTRSVSSGLLLTQPSNSSKLWGFSFAKHTLWRWTKAEGTKMKKRIIMQDYYPHLHLEARVRVLLPPLKSVYLHLIAYPHHIFLHSPDGRARLRAQYTISFIPCELRNTSPGACSADPIRRLRAAVNGRDSSP